MLNDSKLRDTVSTSSSILVQIFSADTNAHHLRAVSAQISARLPQATVVGATTVGEVYEGRLLTSSTVVGITCFESSTLSVMAVPCQGADVRQAGAELGTRISQCPGKIAGVILLATPLSIDAGALLQGIESTAGGFPIFGGGAGDYAAMAHSLVFAGDQQYPQGAVAVVLAGDELHIESGTYLGWRPLSRPMQITEADGLLVKTVDGKPAFDVYQRYLNIPNDENFFLNALEFPFLLERSGDLLARVPIAADGDGALQFIADIQAGLTLLNSTMVAIGLREGETADAGSNRMLALHADTAVGSNDPYAHKHTRVVSRLMRFIDAVTAELEASNREITQLSRTDRLTQLVNRIQLDHVFDDQYARHGYGGPLGRGGIPDHRAECRPKRRGPPRGKTAQRDRGP